MNKHKQTSQHPRFCAFQVCFFLHQSSFSLQRQLSYTCSPPSSYVLRHNYRRKVRNVSRKLLSHMTVYCSPLCSLVVKTKINFVAFFPSTHGITSKRVTNDGIHLRGLAHGQHSEETSQRRRVVDGTVSNLNGPESN